MIKAMIIYGYLVPAVIMLATVALNFKAIKEMTTKTIKNEEFHKASENVKNASIAIGSIIGALIPIKNFINVIAILFGILLKFDALYFYKKYSK